MIAEVKDSETALGSIGIALCMSPVGITELWGLLPLAMSFMARQQWRNVVRYAQCDAVRDVGLRGIAGNEWHRMRAA